MKHIPPAKVWIDGSVVDSAAARVSVFDRGFLYGDSVYEVLRSVAGQALRLPAHLARLAASAKGLKMELPAPSFIENAVRETLSALGTPSAYLRIIVSRGAGPLNLDPAAADEPNLIVLGKPLTLPEPSLYQSGATLALVGERRNATGHVPAFIKSGNYLSSILALAEARRRGAYEALMCDERGRLAEGATSTLFLVLSGVLLTPALSVGILPGITRQAILALCTEESIPCREALLYPSDLALAEEAFITSSIRGVLPVAKVDGQPIGEAPGLVTRRVMALYGERIGEAPPAC